ncbi:hypothetical protein Tco_1555138 [Tanacetum coccineum]
MKNENPIRILGDYSRPSHEGYRNTIDLPDGNNVVPLRSNTIRLATRRTIDQSVDGKLRDNNAEESWELLEDLALYDNDSWNNPRDFAKPVKAISLPQDVPSTSDHHLIEIKNQVQCLMEAHLAPNPPVQMNKIASSCEICSGPRDTQYCMENFKQAFVEYASSRTDEAGGEMPERMEDHGLFTLLCRLGDSKPFDSLADLDMDKDPATPLLVGRGFLATTNTVIDCKKAKITVGEGVTRNMWKSKELTKNKIDWNRPPIEGDGMWHIRIELIDPDGERFKKSFQSIPTTRKLSKKKNPSEIIDLDHLHDF